MDPRMADHGKPNNLPYVLSREYEDYLDWLENQPRPPAGDPPTTKRLGMRWVSPNALLLAAGLAAAARMF